MSDELYRRPTGDAPTPEPVPTPAKELPAEEKLSPPRSERPRHRWGRLLLPLLALAVLLGGIAWWASRRDEQPAAVSIPAASAATSATSASTAVTGKASPSATLAAPVEPAAPAPAPVEESSEYAVQAPGMGTVEKARAHLEQLGFRCEEEQQPGMDSWLCSHYDDLPAMQAYIGGTQGKRLGRLALLVQDGPGGSNPTARGLQHWMVAQMLPEAAQQQAMLSKINKGTEEQYAGGFVGSVSGRGAADGSVVLFVNNWVPDDVQPVHPLQATPLAPALAGLGYRCTGETMINCTASAGVTTRELQVRTEGMEVSHLRLSVTSDGRTAVRPVAVKEAGRVLQLLQGHDVLQAWLDEHSSGVGGLGYANGVTMDWYPGSAEKKASTAVLALRESCWNNDVESC